MLECSSGSADRNLYRFNYGVKSKLLYINYFETCYKNWESPVLETMTRHFKQLTVAPTRDENAAQGTSVKVFLKRNKDIMKKQYEQGQFKVF